VERLTGLDASFLYLETPSLHMHVAMTAVFDPSTMPGGYSFERVKEFIDSRVHLVPPFHRRLIEVPFNVNHPVWIEDPDFDLDYHVRRVGVPAPGGPRELGELAGKIASTQLDRSRPLWELNVVEGLADGQIAFVAKVHHCAVDGVSGAELMVHLFDLEPDAEGPPRQERPAPDHVPTDAELVAHAAASRLRRPLQMLPLAGRTIGSVGNLLRNRLDPESPTGATPLTAPATPFNASISPHRNVAFSRISLADVKAVKDAAGVTVNDVILAVCSGALRRYLEGRRALPETSLLAVCPISVRTGDDDSGSNVVSAMFCSLATDVNDPAKRLAAIHDNTRAGKDEHRAIGGEMLQEWAEYASPATFGLASRLYSSMGLADLHRPIHNVIISNVPGPPFPLYFAGAELQAAYPMGPVMEGAGLNVTVMSYRDSVDVGFMVDRGLLPDVWDLADAVEPAFAELQRAVGA
jgi:WS/DGAT/MGAT family acyltransferase